MSPAPMGSRSQAKFQSRRQIYTFGWLSRLVTELMQNPVMAVDARKEAVAAR